MFFLSSLQSQSISLYTFVKLASTSPQGLCPSSGHANTVRIFPASRRPCWRLVPRKAFVLRRGTPTRSGFSRLPGAFVGALFPAKPLSSVGTRQHGPNSPGLPAPMSGETIKKGGAAHHLFYLFTCYGAGEGNRTLDASLGSSSFTIKLHPQNFLAYYTPITNSRQTFWFDGCIGLIKTSTPFM